MSHELRTPLNAVLGFSQLLLGVGAEPLSDAQRAKLKHIETAGGHLLAMINDVLDLSRVESGSMLLSPDIVQVDAVVGEALAMVANLAQQTGVWLRADPPHRAPGTAALYVRADHVRLCQVLVNLLSNALKYNRSGGSAIIDWRAAADGRGVLIGVSDTGPGLSEAQRAHLFEPFNRLGAERSRVEGTGIGLVITRRLVELMQGQLSVHSELGRGSRFELQLPAAEPAPTAAAEAPGEPPARSVMYAEDNPLNVELVREVLLLRPQYRLLVARSGAEALALATRELPDLLLIDMHLGDMSALDLARLLDDNPTLRSRPRVVLSADAVPERKRQARDAGFAAYLTKPVNVVALLGCLDEHLQRASA